MIFLGNEDAEEVIRDTHGKLAEAIKTLGGLQQPDDPHELPDDDARKAEQQCLDDMVLSLVSDLGCTNLLRDEYFPCCEVQDCREAAVYEGWWRVLDSFLGTSSGLIQKRSVCEEHRSLLICAEEGE